jgi:hydrogenase maturation protease
VRTLKTLVIGLGNPILGDDGVGWLIAHKLQQIYHCKSNVDIDCLSLGGISLMESMIGYDRAILIDAIVTHQTPVGSINCYKLDDLPNPVSEHMSSAHDTTLQNALRIGRELGIQLPKDIAVVTVESQKVYEFSEELTPSVAAAIPKAIKIIQDLLIESNQDYIPQRD